MWLTLLLYALIPVAAVVLRLYAEDTPRSDEPPDSGDKEDGLPVLPLAALRLMSVTADEAGALDASEADFVHKLLILQGVFPEVREFVPPLPAQPRPGGV